MASSAPLLHCAFVDLRRIDPSDREAVAGYAAVRNAVNEADAPWLHALTATSAANDLTYGWDGIPDTAYLGVEDGVPVAVGTVSTTETDNLHLAWLGVKVHPAHRRRGLGSLVLEDLVAEARRRGRSTFGADAWDDERFDRFARRHGFEPASSAINRRQVVADVDADEVARQAAAARLAAADYEVVRRLGATPEAELPAVAEMAGAINDAPLDDLDLEDEVFSADRIRTYERAQEARGDRLYRVLARHLGTGELAGHTVVVVDGERPASAHQHDTSVLAAHRGHRLGLLLKAEMFLWLREAEPQLQSIDTWNAESNDHMIGVNELLGYRVMGREVQYQRKE